ncbi:hypothetical protein EG329_001249 [Mollisiaceae sp. DMI_Dod_QoI]|nr:hypothetical protein EG329_001249 [Helotiales sp. DMI_Dod_QoI]
MYEELDRKLNRETGFKYPTIDSQRQARLLQLAPGRTSLKPIYTLKVVDLEDMRGTHYKALSYTWGKVDGRDDVREIRIDGQPFFIRRNLFDFFAEAVSRDEYGLFFIDAICINQLDHRERQCQVQEMARIYRNASEVIAWLGLPDPAEVDNVQALSQVTNNPHGHCATWTSSQWEGFRYISYHKIWSRIWIVQEVLLASSMTVWCGSCTFPLTLLGGISGREQGPETKFALNGRPNSVMSAASRLRSPAQNITGHRLRHVLQPLKDHTAQGTSVGTMEEMMANLRKRSEKIVTYQSQVPDLLQVLRKFGKLDCSDPRDKLYGLLGLLDERTRAKVQPDYTKPVSYAYYQALKIGLQELYGERRGVIYPDQWEGTVDSYLGYYCDARDAFGMEDGESLSILRRVLDELDFQSWARDAVFEMETQQQFVWRDAEIGVYPDFKELLKLAGRREEVGEGWLFEFHSKQRRVVGNL